MSARSRGLGKLPARGPISPKVLAEKRVFRARVLVRVVQASHYTLKLCVPAWNHRSYFRVPRALFPKHFKFEKGYRFHANINLAALRPADIDFQPPYEEGSTHVPTWKELVNSGAITLEGDPRMVARMLEEKR